MNTKKNSIVDSVTTSKLQELYNRHYIKLDENNNIIDGWSDSVYPMKDTESAICINDKGGYQFRLLHEGDENPSLFSSDMIPLYKMEDEVILRRSNRDIEEDRMNVSKGYVNSQDKIRADLDYVMLMMGLDVDPK